MTPPIRPEADPLARLRAKRQAAEAATQGQPPAAPPKPGYQADPDLSKATFGQRGANVVDGLTFGFGDELAAASGYAVGMLPYALDRLRGRPGNMPDYDKMLQQARTLRAEGQRQRPVESLGLQVAGGVAQGAGLVGALKAGGAPLTAKLLNPSTYRGLAALGAAEGALAGAGSADGTLADRARGAAIGGVVGGIASPALVGVGRGLGRAGGYAVDALNLRAPARQATEAVAERGSRLAGMLKNRTGAVGNGVPQRSPFLGRNTRATVAEGPLAGTRVVDAAGNPRTVFHGTSTAFDTFDPTKLDNASLYGPGYYFTEAAEVANGYTDKFARDATIPDGDRARVADLLRRATVAAEAKNGRTAVPMVPRDEAEAAIQRFLQTGREDDVLDVYGRNVFDSDIYNELETVFAGARMPAPNVRPARLGITNPLDLDAPVAPDAAARILAALERRVPQGADTFRALRAAVDAGETDGLANATDFYRLLTEYSDTPVDKATLNAAIRDAGFDGMTHIGGKVMGAPGQGPQHRVWIAFGRPQIRSAFDPVDRARQVGAVNPAVVNTVAGAGGGALLGMAADDENRTRGAALGAAGGVGLATLLGSQMARRAAGAAGRRLADDAVPSTTPPATGLRALLQRAGVAPIEDRADELVLRAARDARVDLGAAAEKVRRGTGEFPEAVMDVLGERGVQMGAALKTLPSGAKNTLKQTLSARIASTGEDVGRLFRQESGLARRNLVSTVEELVQQQKANARPLYEAAYATAPVDDPAILSAIAGEPRFRQALKVGARIARTEGTPLPADVLEAFTAGGVQGQSLRALPVQAIDLMKRGLDDVIERGMKGGKIGRTEARALRNKLRDVLAEVDAIRPEYAQARAQYAGDAAITEAAELGRDVLNPGKTDALLNAVQRMSDSEREAFRLTAGEQIARMTDGEGSVAQLLKKSSKLRGLFEVVFPDEGAAERFAVKANRRQQLGNNAREVLQNSRTAERQAGQDELAGAAQAVRGGLRGIADRVVDSQLAQAAQGRNAALAEALAQRLLAGAEGGTQGRDALAAQLQRLAAVQAKRKAAVPVKAVAARSAVSRQGATAAGGQTRPRRP